MNLATEYLGLKLRSPLVVGSAAPLSGNLSHLAQWEQEGAGAIVLHSLFLDQIEEEWKEWLHYQHHSRESHPEANNYRPATDPKFLGLEGYLEEISAANSRLSIPVIASLNGSHWASDGSNWLDAAGAIEAAGAQALELNLYTVPNDCLKGSEAIEAEQIQIVHAVSAALSIPVAVKLSPWYTSLAAMARQLERAGAKALVLFNRFYQPDINIESLETVSHLDLSGPGDQRLPLRWIGLLHGRVALQYATSGGVASGDDVVRMLMVGAQVTQVVGALLRHGPGHLERMQQELVLWLQEHEIETLEEIRGCLSQQRCPNPEAFERAQYVRALRSYSPPQEEFR